MLDRLDETDNDEHVDCGELLLLLDAEDDDDDRDDKDDKDDGLGD